GNRYWWQLKDFGRAQADHPCMYSGSPGAECRREPAGSSVDRRRPKITPAHRQDMRGNHRLPSRETRRTESAKPLRTEHSSCAQRALQASDAKDAVNTVE